MSDNFGEDSGQFLRSPMGVGAIIIVLLYAVAGLATGGKWSEEQRWLLSIFLIAYPFVVLGLFYKLFMKGK
jgi:membrane protein DedA with SNARE-associated domain